MASDGSVDLKESFLRLQPLCSRLATAASGIAEPTQIAAAIEDLSRVVPTLPPFGLHRCLDYLFMPLLGLLRNSEDAKLASTQLEGILGVIEAALERCGPVMEMQGEITFMSPRFLQLFHTLVEILSPPSPPAPAASPRSSSSTSASPCAVVLHSTNAARPHEDLKLRAVRCLCALLRTRSPVTATSGTFHLPASTPRVWPLALTVLIVHVMSCVGVAGQPPFIASKSSLALSAYGISLLMDEATTAVNRDLRGTPPTPLAICV
jgi:hypothetical protein